MLDPAETHRNGICSLAHKGRIITRTLFGSILRIACGKESG